ncbi:hypothetical protein [Oceanimonas smirnovii]|uniref:hypothetical protein n=1 Tax=Oceanimonas smirnovii TaxID=264574 RepID=UPI00037E77DE|nr:hypothetical protein [Oceanimonas smirnovii]
MPQNNLNKMHNGRQFEKVEGLAPYDLFEMANLSPTRTGIGGVVIYCGRADDDGQHSPYRIKVSVGKAWGASRKVFSIGTEDKIKGHWFAVQGSEYRNEADAPADLLNRVRKFIDLNQALLKEWVEYDGLEDASERFVPRVKPITG